MPSKLVQAQAAFSVDIARLIVWCHERKILVTMGEAWRPPEMQKIYVQTGRSKTMFSKHLDRLAQDFNFYSILDNRWLTSVKDLEEVGRYWESLSLQNRWGGNFDMNWDKEDNFKDAPHFERRL